MNKLLNHFKQHFVAYTLTTLCLVLVVAMLPKRASFKYDFQLGKPWKHESLLAPFDFAVLKSETILEKEIEEIKSGFSPFFNFDEQLLALKLDHFKGKVTEQLKTEDVENLAFQKVFDKGAEVLSAIYTLGIIDITPEYENKQGLVIQLVKGENVENWPISAFYSLTTAVKKIEEELFEFESELDLNLLVTLLEKELTYNIKYDANRTETQLNEALERISLTQGKVEKDEGVVMRGEIINPEIYQKINSLKEVYDKNKGETGNVWIAIGQGIIVLILLMALILFMKVFIPDLFIGWNKLSFILISVLFAITITKVAGQIEVFSIYIVPLCIIPIVLRAFYNFRVAIFVHLLILLMLGLLVAKPFEFICMNAVAAMAVLYRLGQIKKRSHFFVSAGIVFISYSVVYFSFALIQSGGLSDIDPINFAWLAGSALLTLFAQPSIYMVEKLFGFVSETTLMELSDTNNFLLRELASKAPGTFQHTLQVANLAESCVQQIGGDALLIRAGALYHDIGKMLLPKFFIENQHNGINPHDELEPEASAEIIINHVISGVELARKHGLPEIIVDFIRTHHGTTKTEYFYRQAQAINKDVSPELFTYPGPAPTSREMSVLMMCDSVEAASRSLKEYTKDTINGLVDGIIDHQIKLNQFNNADITFRDISVLKKVLKRKLLDIYHVRVEYPEEVKK